MLHISLLCTEYFGPERVLSGDEEHKSEEKEGDSEEASKTAKKTEITDVTQR